MHRFERAMPDKNLRIGARILNQIYSVQKKSYVFTKLLSKISKTVGAQSSRRRDLWHVLSVKIYIFLPINMIVMNLFEVVKRWVMKDDKNICSLWSMQRCTKSWEYLTKIWARAYCINCDSQIATSSSVRTIERSELIFRNLTVRCEKELTEQFWTDLPSQKNMFVPFWMDFM